MKLLKNCLIWDGESRNGELGWICLDDEKIVDVGSGEPPRFRQCEEIDLGKKHICPGFVDCHTHISVSAWFPYTIDCSPWDSKDKLLQGIKNNSDAVTDDSWVIGFFADFHKINNLPSKAELDEASNGRPVLIVEHGLHQSISNSSALSQFDVGRIKFPSGYVVTKNGVETGLLKEMAHAHALSIALIRFSEQLHDLNIKSLLQSELDRHLSMGITSCHDPCVHPRLQVFMERLAKEHPIKLSWSHVHSEESVELVDENICLSCGEGPKSAKIFLDGGSECAVCLSPIEAFKMSSFTLLDALKGNTDGLVSLSKTRMKYRDGKLHSDFLKKQPKELNQILDKVAGLGKRPKIHALGNEAVECACKSLKETKITDVTIEHLSIMTDREIEMVAEVGAIASLQPGFLESSTALSDGYSDKAMKIIPAKSFLKSDVEVALSSDNPCGPLDPLRNIRMAISRRAYNGRVVNENEALSVNEAIRAYSKGGNKAIHGKSGGGIEQGEDADLCFLSGPPEHSQTRVLETWIRGKEVWPSKVNN